VHPLAHKLKVISQINADVIVDLNGLTGLSSADLLAMRPAPVQMHWHAFPGTLGSRRIVEHYVADPQSVDVSVFWFFGGFFVCLFVCLFCFFPFQMSHCNYGSTL
jgi:hypothetical protein